MTFCMKKIKKKRDSKPNRLLFFKMKTVPEEEEKEAKEKPDDDFR